MSGLVSIEYSAVAQGDGDGLFAFRLPRNGTLVGVTKGLGTKAGNVTGHSLDVKDGAVVVLDNVCDGLDGGEWLTGHFGGEEDAAALEEGKTYTLDVNVTGGGTQALGVIFWVLLGQV